MNSLNTPYVINLLVDTTTTNWVAAEYVAGTFINSYTYTNGAHPKLISFGYTQTTTTAGAFQWGPITMSAVPLAITKNPSSANVNQGANYTNTVIAGGQSPFAYQWYTNGVALVNATNAALIFSPVTNSNASADYYCVVTNAYGAVTSAPASLVVYTTPLFLSANPITYTNPMTLFGGSGANLGSSPSFSVSGGGSLPFSYFWLTNGVAVGGANSTAFTFTNCQMGGPTSFACIISNNLGTATNIWTAQYIPTPTAPYPQLVLADGPAAYWRLDETNYDSLQYNDGEVCNDFMSGNNGYYTNIELAQLPGYYVNNSGTLITNDPTEMAADFGPPNPAPSEAFAIGTNVDFSAPTNAEFSVSCWVNGGYEGNAGNEPVNGGIVAKGGFGTDEFAIDDGASGNDVRFIVRTAGATLVSAASTLQLGGKNNWYHLVGVCDESNGVINLYINGLLAVQATVAKGAGVLPDALVPITIGSDGGGAFYGGIDDVAIFPYALNANQVNALYAAAGGVNPLTFTAPVPPTNVVWRQNSTLTIPATAIGQPPLGYYWTNVTAGGILSPAVGAKGGTGVSAVSSLTATVLITNAPPSLSGDVLELVVTNATGSTNLFVTLFSYPPPITIGYTNSILYSNEFNGGTWNLNGTAMTEVNSLVGGTNTTWIDVLGTNDLGNPGMYGSGLDNTAQGNSWIVPFTPEPGFIYTETAQVTFSAWPGNWIGIGYCQNVVSNTTAARFDDNGPNGLNWILLQDSTANTEFIDGVDNSFVLNQNGFFTVAAYLPHTIQIVLDTTQPAWTQSASVDGVSAGTNTFIAHNPAITGAGITQNALSAAPAPNDVQWNFWALTAVSPNGFAPYLLSPLSTSTITLTNSTVTITNVTGYGTGPWGYYWINNSTTIASGTTNNTAPNSANLSIATSSLSAGNLQLVLTNALGTNITTIPLVSVFSPTHTPIVPTMTNGVLYLTWPAADTGLQLQAQTNSNSKGIGNNWVNFNPSTGVNQVAIPINLTNGTVFYRLTY
jgi:hypothetical protein